MTNSTVCRSIPDSALFGFHSKRERERKRERLEFLGGLSSFLNVPPVVLCVLLETDASTISLRSAAAMRA